ncbi:hypothetical protein BJX66DRAFT_306838 [Aspergillus keveii]|uniref:Uncharacterized protein n=1 Tax=Aspergillus keveii TaxID=714993 RepID=A0ABR4G1P9_9EURO
MMWQSKLPVFSCAWYTSRYLRTSRGTKYIASQWHSAIPTTSNCKICSVLPTPEDLIKSSIFFRNY